MERKIGETFEFKGKTYETVEEPSCFCDFCDLEKECYDRRINFEKVAGSCSAIKRKDTKNVFFKEIKDMEIKDNKLTINIPEGMKVDVENSDLKTGVIKFKKKDITYKDIQDSVGKYLTSDYITPQNCFKLHAIDMLMNIAKYYNKDWKPDWSNYKEPKHYIIFKTDSNSYDVIFRYGISINVVCFKNKEDAQSVIDNPNFREILDANFKN